MGKHDQIKPTPEQLAKSAPTPAPVEAPAAPAAPAKPEAAPAKPAPTAGPEPVESDDHDEGESPGAPSDAANRGKRFRFSDERDQAVALIAKSRKLSLVEAAKVYEADSGRPATPAAEAPAVDPQVANYEEGVAKAKKQIEDLTAQRKKANEELDNEKVLELSDQIADAKTEVRILENERQGYLRNRDQDTKRSYQQQVDQARDRVFAEFTVFANPEGMERMALDAYTQRVIQDPARRPELNDPSWPEKIAKEFATKHGIKAIAAGTPPASTPSPAQPKPVPLTKPQAAQVKPSGAKLLTGADGQRTPSTPSVLTREDALALVRDDPEARKMIVRNLSKMTPGQRR